MRFLGLGLFDRVPDARTIWLFREKLTKAEAIKTLFARFDAALRVGGYIAMSGQIVEASLIAAPRGRNAQAEKRAIKDGRQDPVAGSNDEARRRARSLGFDYIDNSQLLLTSAEKRLERLEALVAGGLENDATAGGALLGTQARPSFPVSKLFYEYEAAIKEEIKKFYPSQLRVWRNGRMRVVKELAEIVGDKQITELTDNDGLDYVEWWRERVLVEETQAGTANKSMGMLSRMLKEASVRRCLKIPEIFKGLRLRTEGANVRSPYERDFIQNKLLADHALDGLNEDARLVLYILADTGLRPSRLVNLQANAIHLDAPIPFVEILPDGRVLKTEDSRREIPPVGAALAAMKLRPNGLPRYRDKSSSLSSTLNKFLLENHRRPTKAHTFIRCGTVPRIARFGGSP
jgi:integrase